MNTINHPQQSSTPLQLRDQQPSSTSTSPSQHITESLKTLSIQESHQSSNDSPPQLVSNASSAISAASSPKSDFSSFQERIIAFQEARLKSTPNSPLEDQTTSYQPFSPPFDPHNHLPSISNQLMNKNIDPRQAPPSMSPELSSTSLNNNDINDSQTQQQPLSGRNSLSSPLNTSSNAFNLSASRNQSNFPPQMAPSPFSAPEIPNWQSPSTFQPRGPILTPQTKARGGPVKQQSLASRRNPKFATLTLASLTEPTPSTPARKRIEGIRSQGLAGATAPPSTAFSNFGKYVDIKNGSLNFNDKASIHSNGVAFSSGKSFKISTNDLEVLGELGCGNYGTVSKALHKPTNVILAMKEVKLELEESKFRQILMELDVLHKCDSPFIVDFFGAFFIEGAVYMCIEYMDGGSLDQIYGEGIDEGKLAYISECVVRGLKDLKDTHNIIHRDVKPTNILVNTEGKVKLCDFGISGNLVASKAKTNIGCQSYMPPERIYSKLPDSAYTVQSDVWSLGISLVEIAIGKFPYPAANNIFEQLSSIVNGEPPSIPKSRNFSVQSSNFIKKCLHKEPSQRPTYAELLEHPWLVNNRRDRFGDKYEKISQEFATFVKSKIQTQEQNKEEQKEREFEQLNESIQSDLLRKKSLKRPSQNNGSGIISENSGT
ncbi:mitogen-activated protein kinase kinase [Saccharomycopsis crataegensis]|uniref:mitogen-activated protein kinase kinase n=1 Tax=Saccharomycopsis crataegensis TaxID=43959 RepID=A0AAV5QLC6_9ASCO|nr:mitogen-activated protein kinase kinase [Saccharomycopsis crataegensis]